MAEKKPIAVAVSGGEDSLLALALLRESGAEVLALHGRFLPGEDDRHRETVDHLARACKRVGAKLEVADLRVPFEELVVAPFVQAYARGLTPNPCCLCNPRIKFGLLLDKALEHGVQAMATGHYVRLDASGRQIRLLRGLDPAKDQSYFLSLVPPARLALARFPLGERFKADTGAALVRRGLSPVRNKPSLEICFVQGDDYKAFLQSRPEDLPVPGPVVLEDGTRVGSHQGLWAHTLGQRRGLGIAWKEPLYVLSKEVESNALVAGPASSLEAQGCTTRDFNHILPVEEWPETVLVQTRYRQRPGSARWEALSDGRIRFSFLESQSLPAPGQIAAASLKNGTMLGGGIIE